MYTTAGRLLLPPLQLGACAAFMAADGAWRLIVVGTDGCLRLWDLQKLLLVIEASVLPLLSKPGGPVDGAPVPVLLLLTRDRIVLSVAYQAGHVEAAHSGSMVTGTVVAVRLASSGAPVAVLSDCSAYILHLGLRSWLKVMDTGHAASAFASSLPAPVSGGRPDMLRVLAPLHSRFLPVLFQHWFCAGDLGRLHAQASAVRPPDPAGRFAALCAGPARLAAESRAHLEANVAAALTLESPQEYRRWLLTYVRFLAGARCKAGAAILFSSCCVHWKGP